MHGVAKPESRFTTTVAARQCGDKTESIWKLYNGNQFVIYVTFAGVIVPVKVSLVNWASTAEDPSLAMKDFFLGGGEYTTKRG